MVGFLEISKKALESYRKDLISTMIFGLAYALAMTLSLIPILGIFIGAYAIPRILGWYYQKVIGDVKPNYRLAFKILLIILFVVFVATIAVWLISKNIFYGLLCFFIVKTILLGIFLYPIYASILGKINKIEINLKKSITLLLYLYTWSLIFIVIFGLLLFYTLFSILYVGEMGSLNYIFLIFATMYIILLGTSIALLFFIFFVFPFVNLVLAHKTLSF